MSIMTRMIRVAGLMMSAIKNQRLCNIFRVDCAIR